MPKIITFNPQVEVRILCDSDGTPQRGDLFFRGSNGSIESCSVGGVGADVVFGTLGSAADRTSFRTVVAAAITAGRTKIGDV